MTTEELKQLLAIHGLVSRVKGQEVALQICLYCGNEKFNCELNAERGVFHCWACGARGRVQTFLKEHLRVERDVPVNTQPVSPQSFALAVVPDLIKPVESPWAWKYLKDRGVDAVDVSIYGIGQGQGLKWDGRIVFPMKDYWRKGVVGFLGRAALATVHPKYFAHWLRGKQITGYAARCDIHVLVEGPFDGLRVNQAGFNAAVLGGVEEKAIEEWGARVPSEDTIGIFLDGDAADQAKKIYWRLVPVHEKTVVVTTPAHIDPAVLDRRVIHQLVRRACEH